MYNKFYQPPIPKPISVVDIYGTNNPVYISENFEFTGDFRPPKLGEWFIEKTFHRASICSIVRDEPRLILREKPKRLVRTFTHTGEVRLPRMGEWFINSRGNYIKAIMDFVTDKHEIIIVTETYV